MGPALLSSQQAGAAGPALCQGTPPCPSLHTQGLTRCARTGVLRPQQGSPLWLSLESSHQLHPCHHLYAGPLVLSPPLAAFTSGKPEGGVESLPALGANQSMGRKGPADLWGPELGKPRCRRGRPGVAAGALEFASPEWDDVVLLPLQKGFPCNRVLRQAVRPLFSARAGIRSGASE